ncbi:hypothetical protein C8Q70DRAFT_936703 [Cubamyces menziesii]|uniref:Uncharacterized protein n=1 Tax=Trametes cubensis TaxID=1111947 RepID=A0AAD7TKB5_9APHY|nr:hypothetical protein C8Q70DRAFT_936703 [Cubamyces menziesii]KAJ8457741.1 hypothetical protein ONZ51_g11350 [Trametes cubensis]
MASELGPLESPQVSQETDARSPRPTQYSGKLPDRDWFCCGYFIKLSALRRYLEKGHKRNYPPLMPAPRTLATLRELDGSPQERLDKLKALWIKKTDIEYRFIANVQQQSLPRIRSFAPAELRARLVNPSGVFLKIPNKVLGSYTRLEAYISTGICPPTDRRLTPTPEDQERLEIYIEAMNGLLCDAVREEASLTSQDFTFASIPLRCVCLPSFTDELVQDMLDYPSLARLYGIPPRYMLRGEVPMKTLERVGLLD